MKEIYVVTDLNTGDIVSVHETMWGARVALMEHLRDDCGYSAGEWADFAENAGYESVEEFQDAIRDYPDYDDDMQMSIEGYVLQD